MRMSPQMQFLKNASIPLMFMKAAATQNQQIHNYSVEDLPIESPPAARRSRHLSPITIYNSKKTTKAIDDILDVHASSIKNDSTTLK